MKNLILFICFISSLISFGNNSVNSIQNTDYTYYVSLSNSNLAPQFSVSGNELIYSGNNAEMSTFFNAYTILVFEQTFPKSKRTSLLNVFLVKTTSSVLIDEMISKFPSIFLSYEDITDHKIEILNTYYPNDYGNTSPVTNLGNDINRKDLDYINAPEAWDIEQGGTPNIIVGISDTAINTILGDLESKTTNLGSTYSDASSTVGNRNHGSSVAAIAAAQGDNSQGTVGVCYNCDIVSSDISYGVLLDLAQAGARVINMSWCGPCYTDSNHVPSPILQDLINEISEDYGVVLVAAAGNRTSFSSPENYIPNGSGDPQTPFGVLDVFPASFDNVISVSGVHHNNPFGSSLWLNHFIDNEDSVSRAAINNSPTNDPLEAVAVTHFAAPNIVSPTNPDGVIPQSTVNKRVDIVAPVRAVYQYGDDSDPASNVVYGQGTSFSAPLVTGTIGLMFSINNCLNRTEIETILKLTTKDIEHTTLHLNTPYYGKIGAGKLEAGNAVNFVNEIKKTDGVAILKDHTFYRYTFNLQNIVNDLVLDNMKFTHNTNFTTSTTVDFTAGNSIRLLPGTTFTPDANGYCRLRVDPSTTACTPSTALYNCFDPTSSDYNCPNNLNRTGQKNNDIDNTRSLIVSPNPFTNSITFNLSKNLDSKNIKLSLFDITGRKIDTSNKYHVTQNKVIFDGSVLNSGIYLYELSIDDNVYTGKVIKN